MAERDREKIAGRGGSGGQREDRQREDREVREKGSMRSFQFETLKTNLASIVSERHVKRALDTSSVWQTKRHRSRNGTRSKSYEAK